MWWRKLLFTCCTAARLWTRAMNEPPIVPEVRHVAVGEPAAPVAWTRDIG